MNACNQKSSREPVVDYDEETVLQALALLRHEAWRSKSAAPGIASKNTRTRLARGSTWAAASPLCCAMLMLRGPQTVGELRGRTERMHEFTELEEVEQLLESLAAMSPRRWSPASRAAAGVICWGSSGPRP